MSKLSNFIWYFGILICIFLLVLFLFTFYFGYGNFTIFLLKFYNKSEKLLIFRTEMLTSFRFRIFQSALLIGALLGIFISIQSHRISRIFLFYSNEMLGLSKELLDSLYAFGFWKRISLLICIGSILMMQFYFLYCFPLQLDEVFTYLYFVKKGFAVSMAYYPGPNNHIFFNLLGCLMTYLPFFAEPVLSLRLISVLLSPLVFVLLLLFFQKYSDFYTALGITVLFFIFPDMMVYGFLGRGYFLMFFFVLVAVSATLQYILNRKKIYTFLYILAASLGFYTIPVFLYPFCSLLIFRLLYYKIFPLKDELKNTLLNFCLVGLFYTPVILFNGGEALFNNSWVQRLPYPDFLNRFPDYLYQLGNFLVLEDWGFLILTLLFLLFAGMLFFQKKTDSLHLLLICFFAIPPVLVFSQSLLPPLRTWIYLSLQIAMIILFGLNIFFRPTHRIFIVWAMVLGIGLPAFYALDQLNFQGNHYQVIARKIAENEPDKIFADEDTYQVFLRYELEKKDLVYTIRTSGFELSENYDCIIFSKKTNKNLNFEEKMYQKIFENEEVLVYTKK